MDDIELKPAFTGHRRPAADRGANPFLVRPERCRTAIPTFDAKRARSLQREKHDDRRGRPEPSIRPQTTGASTQYTRGVPRRASRDAARRAEAETAEGWATCLKVMTEYDGKMIKGWKEEMDGLLIFVSSTYPSLVSRAR